jgi:hypothetical protein
LEESWLIIEMQLMLRESDSHVSEDQLECYSAGSLPETAVARVEEHVLVCETCQDKLAFADAWVLSVRRAGAQLRREPESTRDAAAFSSAGLLESLWHRLRVPHFVPALAASLIVLFAVGWFLQSNKRVAVAPLAVSLEATRGEAVAHVPAHQPLAIHPNLDGLPQFSAYRLQIVDAVGKQVFQSSLAPVPGQNPASIVSGVTPGVYFARVYSPAGDLLREYALEARASH